MRTRSETPMMSNIKFHHIPKEFFSGPQYIKFYFDKTVLRPFNRDQNRFIYADESERCQHKPTFIFYIHSAMRLF